MNTGRVPQILLSRSETAGLPNLTGNVRAFYARTQVPVRYRLSAQRLGKDILL